MLKNLSNEDLIKALRAFQTLAPRADFVARGRAQFTGGPAPVLTTSPTVWFYWFKNYWQVPAFSLLLMAMFIFSYHLLATSTKLVFSALNSEKITEEYAGLINIQLSELKYQQKADLAIASALNEIANNTSHLNSSVLESEIRSLDIPEGSSDNVDSLLEKIIF